MEINRTVTELMEYGIRRGLIEKENEAYVLSRILEILRLDEFKNTPSDGERELSEILHDITDYAFERGLIDGDGVVYRDLFDTSVMGAMTPRPSEVNAKFRELYSISPEAATDYFYRLACDTNYIRVDRIRRDMRWQAESEFGTLDLSVNLSKPEKDPKAIAAAKLLPQSDYPKCALCHENEGFCGTLTKPARQNLRQIPFDMDGSPWYLQYSPYVYYNEHCIALSANHTPMSINSSTFRKLLGFVHTFPHYFIGSNADLPIVGGSILSHDHMQGGRYSFAMERAECETELSFDGFEDVTSEIVRWPMSVIRLRGKDRERMIFLADKILSAWRGYSDPEADILSESDGEPHNTITPIARRRGEQYELDLVLRNNRRTKEHPLGLFHPHAEHHNIKKENIGLIEVMGLAVLPSRLMSEMDEMRRAILSGGDFSEIPALRKHAAWFAAFRDEYTFTEDNVDEIIRSEIAKTFVRVLSDAGVYKCTESGRAAFLRFVAHVNSTLNI